MAAGYALDTNVYIDALRDRNQLGELKEFLSRFGARVSLSGVVAMELGAGALTREQQGGVDDLIGAFGRRGRMFGVSFEACQQAGRVLAGLANRERVRLATAPPSLTNDVLMAVSCREADVVLVTSNFRDFTRIQRHLRGFRFVAPWP